MGRSYHSRKKQKTPDRFEIEIESLDQNGRGVGHREGKAVFVEGALPRERVIYERVRNKASFEDGRIVKLLREGPLRVKPRCPHFGLEPGCCGGCAMQHLDPAAQVAMKQRVLIDALWHIGKLRPELVLPPIYGPYWGYRHRARLSVRDVAKKGGVLVGFHERSSSFVAQMHCCPILPRHVSDMIDPLRGLVESLKIRQRLPQIEVAVDGRGRTALVFRHLVPIEKDDLDQLLAFGREHGADIWLQPAGPDSAAPVDPALRDALRLTLPEFGVEIPFRPTDFTQVNHDLNRVMVSRAVRMLELEPGMHAVDFFCGLGNFTLPLARRCARVTGLEGSEGLVARARAGAAANGLSDKTDFVARNLFTWSQKDWDALWERSSGIDRVLLDPPREGAQAVAQVLAASARRPGRVVYVSCNPATLARDCAILMHQGGWRLAAAGVMNMFPHTGHVESIALLLPGPKPAQGEGEKKSEKGGAGPAAC
ncbi:23S rRNA (uracil(1939)-C(5))-methyltransferase RlmD [Mesosutterella sp. AGMB02718]|uniref:23S rRNA (uracil(1939)-C(5))-methyltransferase RlmD n=1 Tax=Mesosutterella faecium TaxID=2925194 RepID=A0ABT7ILJ4_9BURK|nr:23S rRNA (uracil(1939)-C(5))-methyltransferase RlmD [Mesosutterella sp. AGMB02718]MDL2059228.1 23S rRNA (uracil(1939)-C(5))-methyltransferase RlmD [Mesosutterella sp. AGMB02718]